MKKGVSNLLLTVLVAGALALGVPVAIPQNSRTRSERDRVEKYIIDMERQWAESGCTHQPVAEKIFAGDFQGTAPSGERYDKAKALHRDDSLSERECHLDEASVLFYGDSVAIAYGSERAMVKPQGLPEHQRCLIWTDTWLDRNDNWQIVSAQDTALPCK